MSWYKKLLVIPIVAIIISVYFIGLNFYEKYDTVDDEKSNKVELVEVSGNETVKNVDAEVNEDSVKTENDIRVNINTATQKELEAINGIGKTLAERIIAKRDELGRFSTTEEIKYVNGIGDKLYLKIKDYIYAD